MSADDLLRAFAEKHAGEASHVASLLNKPESDLYAMLAARVSSPSAAIGSVDDRFRTVLDRDDLQRGPGAELGKRIFLRCSKAVHDFCCSSNAEDKKLRDQMINAIFSKDGGGVALLAGGLVAALGLSPAVAAVVAALLVKLIVAPSIEELCSTWTKSLKR